jgi:hypothetical protein
MLAQEHLDLVEIMALALLLRWVPQLIWWVTRLITIFIFSTPPMLVYGKLPLLPGILLVLF